LTKTGSAKRLRDAGVPPQQVSHFLTQCVFCFFAEDTGLLPGRLFERLVGVATPPERLRAQLQKLFEAMREGGLFGVDDVPWFNGGLFATIAVPPLAADDVAAVVPRNEAALGKSRKHGDKAWRDAQAAFAGYLERLRNVRGSTRLAAAATSCTWRSSA